MGIYHKLYNGEDSMIMLLNQDEGAIKDVSDICGFEDRDGIKRIVHNQDYLLEWEERLKIESKKINETLEEIEGLKKEFNETKHEIEEEKKELEKEIEKYRQDIIRKEIDSLREDLTKKDEDKEKLNKEIENLRKDLTKRDEDKENNSRFKEK